jgi:shikimate kinase
MVFVVVSGLPGAGKSTVGEVVANQLQVPCLDKDDFLDRLLDCSSNPQRERSTLSRSADAMFIERARQTGGAVLVSFWQRPELSTRSGTPTEWLAELPDPIELWCQCPPEIAVHRFLNRRRHPGHGDEPRRSDQLLEQFESLDRLGPLGVGRLIRIDSSGPIDIDGLAERILHPGAGQRSVS